MKRAIRWFNERATQDTRARIATLPVLTRVGPDNPSEPASDRNAKDEKYFVAENSEVDGEEVVG